MHPQRGRALLLGAISMSAGVAVADPNYAAIEVNEGIAVTPTLGYEARYDDNIFQTDDNEKDSLVTVLRPGVVVDARRDAASMKVSYAAEVGWVHDSTADNYQDHIGRVDFGLKGSRSFAKVGVFHEREHDDRGTGPSNGLGNLTTVAFDEPTEFQRAGVEGRIGAEFVDRWRVELGGNLDNTNYKNFRAFTRDRDRESDERSAGVYFEVSPRTELLAEVSRRELEYDNVPLINNLPGVRLDSQETRYLGGVRWEATAATTGAVKIGVVDKQFEDGRRNDRENATYDVLVTYQPLSHVRLSATAFRGPRETDGQGDAIDATAYGLRWEHEWSGRVRTDVGVTFSEEDYQGAARNDDFTRVHAEVAYDWQRWITLKGGWRFSTRDSNQVATDFDRNVIFVSASAGL